MKTICFRRHISFLNSVKMEDSESQMLSDEEQTPEPLLGSLDIFLFSLIAGLLIYWFFFRKKPEPVPEMKPFTPTSFIEKMKKTNRNVVVFYGSQTGTAEEFANRLAKDAQRYGMKGMPTDPEEYDMSELSRLKEIPNSMAVFCMATYGEGDPTDNAQEFYDWMQGTDDDLAGVNFAVFGLGNKTYEHFNATGKYTDKRLAELGGNRVFDLGLGDDDSNLEEDFISWKEQFWPAVCEFFGVEATGEDSSIRQFELVVHNDINMNEVYTGEMGRLKSFQTQKPPFDSKNPFLATVTGNRKLNEGGNRHLMHIELDITDSKIRYDSGDHVAVYPTNDAAVVNRIGERLGVDLDTVISLKNLDEESNKKHPFPCPTTYRTALTHYLDINNTPRTNVLFELAQYASDPQEQENMRKMASASPEGKALYHSWVLDSERNILAILEDLPSLNPPIDHLCELLPRLQARYYSIASSSKVKAAKESSRVWPPTDPNSFLLSVAGKEVGETILYFGCRHKNEDFLYQQELEEFERAGVLTQLNVAFSRDQEHKIYVQHLLKKNKEQLWKLIHSNNAHIYVCGDARNMARDVHTAFYEIAEEVGGLTHTQAVDYFKKLMTKGRYSQDVWS
uniref:NADPH--hemoprotein reductase n=1 Tax=Cyprinus carpio TaxID=7962 RepID=A0A8C1JF45_CYPCA